MQPITQPIPMAKNPFRENPFKRKQPLDFSPSSDSSTPTPSTVSRTPTPNSSQYQSPLSNFPKLTPLKKKPLPTPPTKTDDVPVYSLDLLFQEAAVVPTKEPAPLAPVIQTPVEIHMDLDQVMLDTWASKYSEMVRKSLEQGKFPDYRHIYFTGQIRDYKDVVIAHLKIINDRLRYVLGSNIMRAPQLPKCFRVEKEILDHINSALQICPELLEHHQKKTPIDPKISRKEIDNILTLGFLPKPEIDIVATALLHQKINIEIVLFSHQIDSMPKKLPVKEVKNILIEVHNLLFLATKFCESYGVLTISLKHAINYINKSLLPRCRNVKKQIEEQQTDPKPLKS
jgi:hypothetical protein